MTEDEIRKHGAVLEVAGVRFCGLKATAMLAVVGFPKSGSPESK